MNKIPDEGLKSKSVLLYDLTNKQVIFEKNPDKRLPFASIVKVITSILAIEKCPDPENTLIEMEEEVLNYVLPYRPSLSALSFYPGKCFPVVDFVYAALLNSGCEAARQLALYIGDGDIAVYLDNVSSFLDRLGCKDTNVIDPTGLIDEGQYSTAGDIARFFIYAMNNPLFAKAVSACQYKSSYLPETLDTTNDLINPESDYFNACAIGGKTGTTDVAGRCLVCGFEMEENRYVLVSLGFPCIGTEENKKQFFAGEINSLIKRLHPDTEPRIPDRS